MPIAPNLTIRALLDVSAAINLLEGTPTIIKDEAGNDRTITVPYKFNGKARWNLHKNTGLLKKISEKFVADRDALILSISGGSGRIEQTDEVNTKLFTEKVTELIDSLVPTTGILSLSVADLNLDENQIPLNVLAALDPIISE